MKTMLLLSLVLLSGCQLIHRRPNIHVGKDTVTPPENASAPTTVNKGEKVTTETTPKGSIITTTETPATPTEPAKKVTTITLSADMITTTRENTTQVSVAPPRPPDKTVELKKVANDERRPFLFAAIAFLVGAGALAYFRLTPLAKLAGFGAGVCMVFWWAIGNEKLLTWGLVVLAAFTAGYVIYSDWKKKRLQGTLTKTVQSVEEFSVDHPTAAKILKQEYLAPNMDDAHKQEVAKAEEKINTSYIDQVVKEKISSPAA